MPSFTFPEIDFPLFCRILSIGTHDPLLSTPLFSKSDPHSYNMAHYMGCIKHGSIDHAGFSQQLPIRYILFLTEHDS